MTDINFYLQEKNKHVSLENLLSGSGLSTIYRYFAETGDIKESPRVTEEMHYKEPAAVITEYAESGDELCSQSLDCFVDIYGAAAGNVALQYYPIKELYIAGGIAPKIRKRIETGRFIKAFVDKGLMQSVMEKISVKLIVGKDTGLEGALIYIKTLYL